MRALAFTLLLALGACKGPITDPGHLMLEASGYPAAAPADKALVFVHRPRAYQGHPLYLGVWLDRQVLADLGNGHSTYVELEPGQHTFVGRSAEVKTVIEAELAAGKTYDLVAHTAGAWIASFRLVPIDGAEESREDIPAWLEEHLIVTLVPRDDPELVAYSAELLPKIDTILSEAAAGSLPVFTLRADQHRP
jgi:hypothetical protein